MIKSLVALMIIAVGVRMAQAQGPAAPTPQPTGVPGASRSPSPTPLTSTLPQDPLSGVIEDYTYSPEGKRDPFIPFDVAEAQALELGSRMGMGPVFPLQKYDLDQLKLVGIIWGVAQPKAMLTDPTGRGHVVKVNDRMGRNNGYVARIREGEIVVIESFKGLDGRVSYQTKILKLGNE